MHMKAKVKFNVPLPPGLSPGTAARIPRDLRDDAIQEAWLAALSGRDPNKAVWGCVTGGTRLKRRDIPFSQLDLDTQRHIWEEVPA